MECGLEENLQQSWTHERFALVEKAPPLPSSPQVLGLPKVQPGVWVGQLALVAGQEDVGHRRGPAAFACYCHLRWAATILFVEAVPLAVLATYRGWNWQLSCCDSSSRTGEKLPKIAQTATEKQLPCARVTSTSTLKALACAQSIGMKIWRRNRSGCGQHCGLYLALCCAAQRCRLDFAWGSFQHYA